LFPLALEAAARFEPMTDDERSEAIDADLDDELIFPIPV
jgi:hypothetical protein